MFAVVCCIIASSCTVFVERHFYNVHYSQNYIHRVTSGLSIGSEAVISSLCDRPITDSGTAYVRNIKSSSNHVTKLFNIMAVMKRSEADVGSFCNILRSFYPNAKTANLTHFFAGQTNCKKLGTRVK